ncbi:hypothetical protein HY948_05085 [Candidatus Gottesmanbacteria bacterium]|nr:hypothetical protein [Candidatus Gottesmanbacteria bacterium]
MNNFLATEGQVLATSLQNVSAKVMELLPSIVLALIVFLVGWFIASIVATAVSQIVKALKVDGVLKNIGLEDALNKGGWSLDSASFLGSLVKLFVIIVFLVASLDILGLSQVNLLLQELVVGFLPNIFVVIILLIIAAFVAEILSKLVMGSARASGVSSASAAILGKLAAWIVWVVAVLMSLSQLNIGVAVLNTLFLAVVSGLALAFGLAFGLGGKDVAAYYLERFKRDIGH